MKRIKVIMGGLLCGALALQGEVTSDDKGDPMGFPLIIRSQIQKPKIMSLVVDVKGDHNRYLSNDESFALVPGRLIPSKGLLLVPAESRVIFRPMPGITTLVDADSKLQLKGLDVVKSGDKIAKRKAYLYLNEGSVFTSIQKMNHKTTTYEIQTPQAVCGARGTKFWVTYRDGKGKVGVINGVVSVKLTTGTTVTLKQNEFMDIVGVGKDLKVGDVRQPTDEEINASEDASQLISKVEGVTSSSVNPFLTTTEASSGPDNGLFEESASDADRSNPSVPTNGTPNGTPNGNNTSTNTTVSPVGP